MLPSLANSSRHSRHTHPGYFFFSSSLCSSVSLTSAHQHPASVAPHTNAFPHAPHVSGARAPAEKSAFSFGHLISKAALPYFDWLRAFTSSDVNP